jgi:hypothetical protein
MDKEPKVRLTVDLSRKDHDRITTAAKDMDCTKVQLVKKAFDLLLLSIEARKSNLRVGFINSDNQLVTEIIGI